MQSVRMHLVQLLLPLFDNDGQTFPDSTMRGIREELAARFGGFTAFSRTPAEGVWSKQGSNVRDDIILVEVMVEELDVTWWRHFREELEQRLRQQSLVVRVFSVTRL